MLIEKRKYTGYIWMSDDPSPKVLLGEEFGGEFAETANPFIIEAQLYDGEKNSVSVKYVDGKYIMHEYTDVDVSSANEDVELKEYIAHARIAECNGNKNLLFLQYWEEKQDDATAPTRSGMVELRPGKLVFVGFKK